MWRSVQYINTVERADKLGRVLYDVTATVVVWYCILLHGAHVYYSIWNKYNAYAWSALINVNITSSFLHSYIKPLTNS